MSKKAKILQWVLRLALGGVFIYAAISKIDDPAVFADAIEKFDMLPGFAIGPLALGMPMLELIAGVMLIATPWRREAAFLVTAMLAIFLVALTQAAIRDLDIDCGCFGFDESAPTGRVAIMLDILRDVIMIVPAIWLMRRDGNESKS